MRGVGVEEGVVEAEVEVEGAGVEEGARRGAAVATNTPSALIALGAAEEAVEVEEEGGRREGVSIDFLASSAPSFPLLSSSSAAIPPLLLNTSKALARSFCSFSSWTFLICWAAEGRWREREGGEGEEALRAIAEKAALGARSRPETADPEVTGRGRERRWLS